MQLMNPCGAFETRATPLTERGALTSATVVGLFANDKKNADVLLERVRVRLERDHGIEKFRWFRKEASQPAVFTQAFTDECDVVVAAICD
jgi:hypothetical protein